MQLFRAVFRAPDKTIVLFKLNTQTELTEQQLGKSPMYYVWNKWTLNVQIGAQNEVFVW